MPFNFSSPEFLSHSKLRKNQVSPVRRASSAHMNNPLVGFSTAQPVHSSQFSPEAKWGK